MAELFRILLMFVGLVTASPPATTPSAVRLPVAIHRVVVHHAVAVVHPAYPIRHCETIYTYGGLGRALWYRVREPAVPYVVRCSPPG